MFDEGLDILGKLLNAEGFLAHDRMNISMVVVAKLYLAGPEILNRSDYVIGNGSGLGRRHLRMRSKHTAKLSDITHHRRMGDGYIKTEPTIQDLLGKLL